MIDLDANATTAMLPEVVDAMLPWLRVNYANPSGSYRAAKLARKAIDSARCQVAELIGASHEEIVFTGSGTESVNTALHSLDVLAGEGSALVSSIEHSAVLRYVENRQRQVRIAAVDSSGRVDIDSYASVCERAAYVSVMMANNETGVMQPITELSEIAHAKGLPFHTDASQAAGKTSISVKDHSVDMLSLSAHKFHGPKGIGALYVREGLGFSPLVYGGGQEKGRRSGTENTASIVAMGMAAELARNALSDQSGNRLTEMRDAFEKEVMAGVSGCIRNGSIDHRLPNTSHLSFEGCDSAGLLILLDEAGVSCSAGSACMTGKQKPSHVQLAMGISKSRAKTSLRFSFSRINTMAEALEAGEMVIKAVLKLRTVQGGDVGPVAIYTG